VTLNVFEIKNETPPNDKLLIELYSGQKRIGVFELFYDDNMKKNEDLENDSADHPDQQMEQIAMFIKECLSSLAVMLESVVQDINELKEDIDYFFITPDQSAKRKLEELIADFKIEDIPIDSIRADSSQTKLRNDYFNRLFYMPYSKENSDSPILRYVIKPKSQKEAETGEEKRTQAAKLMKDIEEEIGDVNVLIYYSPDQHTYRIELKANFYKAESVIISESRPLLMQYVAGMFIQYGMEIYKLLGSLHRSMTGAIPFSRLKDYINYLFKNMGSTQIYENCAKLSIFNLDDLIIEIKHKLDTIFFTTTFNLNQNVQSYLQTTESKLIFMRAFPATSQYFMAPIIQIYFFELFMGLGLYDIPSKIDLTYFRRHGNIYESDKMPEGDISNYRLIGLNHYFDVMARISFCDESDGEIRHELVYVPPEIPEIKTFVVQTQTHRPEVVRRQTLKARILEEHETQPAKGTFTRRARNTLEVKISLTKPKEPSLKTKKTPTDLNNTKNLHVLRVQNLSSKNALITTTDSGRDVSLPMGPVNTMKPISLVTTKYSKMASLLNLSQKPSPKKLDRLLSGQPERFVPKLQDKKLSLVPNTVPRIINPGMLLVIHGKRHKSNYFALI